jgi:hypothetical protein
MARITLVIDIHFRRGRWDRLACVRASQFWLASMGSRAKAPTAGRKRPIYEQLKRRQEVSTKQRKHEPDVETGVGLEAGR